MSPGLRSRRKFRPGTRSSGVPALSAPVNTAAPVVTPSTATTGTTLTTTNGAWSANPSPAFTYQWQKAGVNIAAATASTYVVQAGDLTNAITCNVTATNSQGNATATSNSVTPTASSYTPNAAVLALSPTGWWDASSLSVADGSAVSAWNDVSGNSRNLGQAGGTAQPLSKTAANGINSQNVVRFDGVNDYMDYVGGADWITGTTLTVFAVLKRISWVNGAAVCATLANGGTDDWNTAATFICGLQNTASTALADFRANNSLSSATHPGNGVPYVQESLWDGSANTLLINGTASSPTISTGTLAVRRILVGARSETTLVKFANHDLAELIVFNTALSSGNRSTVRSYLGTKYGITVI